MQSCVTADLGLRPAHPEDVELAVPLIYSAGVETVNYMFRTTSHDFLRHAFVRP